MGSYLKEKIIIHPRPKDKNVDSGLSFVTKATGVPLDSCPVFPYSVDLWTSLHCVLSQEWADGTRSPSSPTSGTRTTVGVVPSETDPKPLGCTD